MSLWDGKEPFLEYGRLAVEQPIEQVLGGAEPMDDGKKKPKKSKGKLVVFVSGAWNAYTEKPEEEVEAIVNGGWRPQTRDFVATAAPNIADRSIKKYDSYKITSASEFFGTLQGTSGTISRLVFIGHCSGFALGLKSNNGYLQERLGPDEIAQYELLLPEIADKFADDATIDLVACDSAKSIGTALAKAFQRRVRGFGGAVYWARPIKPGEREIDETLRGRVGFDDQTFTQGLDNLDFSTAKSIDP